MWRYAGLKAETSHQTLGLNTETRQSPCLSIPWWCLPTSSSVCLVFFPLALCLARCFWPNLMNVWPFTEIRTRPYFTRVMRCKMMVENSLLPGLDQIDKGPPLDSIWVQYEVSYLVGQCFEPNQPHRITTGLDTNFTLISKLFISQVIIPQVYRMR